MGLDVYLYKEPLETRQAEAELVSQYSTESEAIWDKAIGDRDYSNLSTEEKDKCSKDCEDLAASLGLDKEGCSTLKTDARQDSKLYPDHMFKIGYFRSSYNGAGTNSVLRKVGVGQMQDLFEVGDDYHVVPDWKVCLENIEGAIVKFQEFMKTDVSKYEVEICNCFSFIDDSDSTEKTMDIFMELLKSHPEGEFGRNLSSKEGFFFLNGKKIMGFRPVKSIGGLNIHLICESEMEDGGTTYDWYLKALEIMKETCEWVLAQDKPEDYTMHWSG